MVSGDHLQVDAVTSVARVGQAGPPTSDCRGVGVEVGRVASTKW